MKLVAVFITLLITIVAAADEYRDAFRRFTITPPAGWIKVSDADVKKFDDFVAGRMKDRNFHYIAAFTKDPKKPLEPPYVMIQETNVRLKGGNYDGLEKSLNAIDISQATTDAGAKLSDVLADFKADQWVVDRAHNRMMMNMSMTDATGKKIKATCTAYFGEESIIQINCYAPEAKFAQHLLQFNNFNHGFQWDAGAEFKPVVSGMNDTVKYALIGGGIGALWGVISFCKKKYFD